MLPRNKRRGGRKGAGEPGLFLGKPTEPWAGERGRGAGRRCWLWIYSVLERRRLGGAACSQGQLAAMLPLTAPLPCRRGGWHKPGRITHGSWGLSIPAVVPELSIPAARRVLGAHAPVACSHHPSLARSPHPILAPHSRVGCRGRAQPLPAGKEKPLPAGQQKPLPASFQAKVKTPLNLLLVLK